MRQMINPVTEGVALDFGMDGEGTMLGIVVKLHLRGVIASLAVDKITDGGVFHDHTRPEGVTRKTEKIGTLISGDFDDDIGPAGQNMFGVLDLVLGKSLGDDLI